MKASNAAWAASNIFGYIFGWSVLAPLHALMAHVALHALGYDNMLRPSWTGEEWFVRTKLSPTKPTVCIDVGANVGNYTNMLLQHTNAHVYAIDPLEGSHASLQTLGPRVTRIKGAISNFNGEAPFYHQSSTDGMASLDRTVRMGTATTVPVMTLESLCEQHGIVTVDFLKIDTEGYEREVLEGLGQLRPSFIQFEFNIHHLLRKCSVHELSQLLPGYEFYRLLPHGWLTIHPAKYINNIYMFCNIVAVRKDGNNNGH